MMFFRARTSNSHLAQSQIVLSVKRHNHYRHLTFICVLLLLALSADRFCVPCQQWSWWPKSLSASAHASIVAHEQAQQQQRGHLQQEIDRLLLEQRIESAVREKLEQQITDLQAQIKAAKLQLDFFKSKQGPTK